MPNEGMPMPRRGESLDERDAKDDTSSWLTDEETLDMAESEERGDESSPGDDEPGWTEGDSGEPSIEDRQP